MSCSCGKATYFNVGQKDPVYPFYNQVFSAAKFSGFATNIFKKNTLEEDDLELNPDDAATEEDEEVDTLSLLNPSVTGASKLARTITPLKTTGNVNVTPLKTSGVVNVVTPIKPAEKYPKLSAQYKAVCLDPKGRQVNVTIDQIVDAAQNAPNSPLARIYTHQLSYIQPFSNFQHSSLIAGTARLTVISPPIRLVPQLNGNIGKTFHVLEADSEQLSANVGLTATKNHELIASYQPHVSLFPVPNVPPKEETLGAIIKAWARGINRLCEEDELVASTPIEYLSTLWDNYVLTSAPAVVNDASLKTLTTRILTEIVKIWIVRCECAALIAAADPTGNYNAQKTGGETACQSLCKKKVTFSPLTFGKNIGTVFKK
jgi:hypothetical protein